jgi:hypothetical protein
LFTSAIEVEYEYYIQQERRKEELRADREKRRQEAEERKELARAEKQTKMEASKFLSQIETEKQAATHETDPERLRLHYNRIEELGQQAQAMMAKLDQITTLQHGLAGYVYVISNLGAFGETVFKIGMTRRLEPTERIHELGDASVPFPFDVHALIFSDDAVELEGQLHKTLNDKRLNKVNLRKEFFSLSLDELEELVYSIQPSAEFNRTMPAQQYRQTDAVKEIPLRINTTDFDDDDDETDEEDS